MVQYINNSGFQQFMAAKDSQKKSNFGSILVWVAIAALAGWLISTWMMPEKSTIKNQKPTEAIATQSDEISKEPVHWLAGQKIDTGVRGIRIEFVRLTNYTQTKNSDDKVVLFNPEKNEFAEIGIIASGTNAPTAATVWKESQWPHTKEFDKPAIMTWRNPDGVEFVRTIAIENYVISIKDEIKNTTSRDFSITPYARIVRGAGEDTAGVSTGGIVFENDGIERESWKSIGKKSYSFLSPTGFVGFEDQYWQTIVSLSAPDQTIKMKPMGDGRLVAESSAAPIAVPAGKTVTFTTNLFAGPKIPEILNTANESITGINQTIDYGWFWFLSRPFLWALNALFDLVHNWGLAIIVLTIIIRIFMWPLTRKSFVGMAAMQKMQPEMQRIQKLYSDDKVRMQQEMMKLYRESKTSPMSGCLPMLLQIPIFFALYKALLIAVPLRQAQFLWISDLAVMDPYFILPVLMGVSMWWQQHLQMKSTAPADPNNPMAQTQKFMKWMPVLFTALFAWMPAGLVLYWTVSNIFGIGQMWWIKRTSK